MNEFTHFPDPRDGETNAKDWSSQAHSQGPASSGIRGREDFDAFPDASGHGLSKAANSGRAYAKEAVNSAGKKIDAWKGQLDRTTESCASYIKDEPTKAIMLAAACGSLLAALLMTSTRRSRPSYYRATP
ncbi:hypothetical protein QTI66_34630 [Variovorax sp. J22R133]|uniref:hypothetical protein n=1 Tax=Variovorax brevis TaxID=3053503 RepID=UPI002577B408|nr:hypothetical protein [Variovorax sp. J22R133]MDM0117258.1 hypothetical protein [Variovorax sp. J22R133]